MNIRGDLVNRSIFKGELVENLVDIRGESMNLNESYRRLNQPK